MGINVSENIYFCVARVQSQHKAENSLLGCAGEIAPYTECEMSDTTLQKECRLAHTTCRRREFCFTLQIYIEQSLAGDSIPNIPFYLFRVHRICSDVPSLISDISNTTFFSFILSQDTGLLISLILEELEFYFIFPVYFPFQCN